jgi:hypothetical protein
MATPTRNGESVISRMSHPRETCSIPNPREWSTIDPNKNLKSRYLNEVAQVALPDKNVDRGMSPY